MLELFNKFGASEHKLAREMAVLKTCSVLVTGSNRGIGLELVKQLVGRSNRPEWIFASCRDPEGPRAQELKQLAAKHKGVEIIPLDASKSSSIRNAAARVTEQLKGTGLNLLINNAAILRPNATLDSETAEDMAEVYRTNVIGPMEVSQAFLPLLKRASQASSEKGMSCSRAAIINVSSEGGSIKNILEWRMAHIVSYRCSKAALNMLTRCQSLAYAEDKILCIALHPGWVQTDMASTLPEQAPLTLDYSIQSILNTLPNLSEKHTGTFVNWEGETLPW
uniref:C-factor-like n=1 Tax=Salvator merianae TaxID=96440 RepID=A0A8D0BY55_SALMN